MVKFAKIGTSIKISKSTSVEQAFLGDFIPNFKGRLNEGKKIKHIHLLPRELLGLIVTSVVINIASQEPYTIGLENFFGLDGLIVRSDIDRQPYGYRPGLFFEQVYVYPGPNSTFITRLQKSLRKKTSKGKQYSDNINLIILIEESVALDLIENAIKDLTYEMVVLIRALKPQPFHFDLNILKNTDNLEKFRTCKIYIDKFSGIQQAIIKNERYLVINGVGATTHYRLPLQWRIA